MLLFDVITLDFVSIVPANQSRLVLGLVVLVHIHAWSCDLRRFTLVKNGSGIACSLLQLFLSSVLRDTSV